MVHWDFEYNRLYVNWKKKKEKKRDETKKRRRRRETGDQMLGALGHAPFIYFLSAFPPPSSVPNPNLPRFSLMAISSRIAVVGDVVSFSFSFQLVDFDDSSSFFLLILYIPLVNTLLFKGIQRKFLYSWIFFCICIAPLTVERFPAWALGFTRRFQGTSTIAGTLFSFFNRYEAKLRTWYWKFCLENIHLCAWLSFLMVLIFHSCCLHIWKLLFAYVVGVSIELR